MANGQVVAVVGATGAVGQTTLKLLEERNFPVRDIRLFASARSLGKKLTFKGESLPVEVVSTESFKGIDFAFFSAGGSQSKELAPYAVKAGAVVIDKSSAFRMDPAVPLVVPEINGAEARKHQGIVSCPNCTTIVTVMPLKPLHDAGKLRRVVATSFQAVSGAGVGGIEELRAQAMAWSKGEKLTSKFFQHQIAFNLLPAGDIGEGGYTGEETKLIKETRKILGIPELPVCPTTVRVPVFTTHSIAVNAETERKVTAAQARAAFERFPGLRVYDDPAQNKYPMPILVEGQDDCFVGRIREDISIANGINFWVVGDQLRKGAALNGIQIAEFLIN
jgi:aspartate-semialdehyde dehydrogenase